VHRASRSVIVVTSTSRDRSEIDRAL